MRSAAPKRVKAFLAFALAPCVVIACLPDPDKDFDDYTGKTASFRAANVPKDAGPIDSQAPTEAVTGIYYGACLSSLAVEHINKVLSFFTETSFTPDPGGSGGKLTMVFTPLKINADGTPPTTCSKSNEDGSAITLQDAPVDAKGVFQPGTIPGNLAVPADANPISMRDIVIENAAIPGRFQEAQFCTQLSGHVTQPIDIALDPSQNTCIFFSLKDGDPVPTLTLDMFNAGCPLN